MMWNELQCRADLHVHSKYSDRPSEWFLRRMGAPECYVEPSEVYHSAKRRGMDFVTISDHNCIQGALEIAHLPGTFLSCELTTYFPENKCKIHCLVHDITESQFRELSKARRNIHDLHSVLHEQDICHAIAHPLFRINESLTLEQFEKLLLMFKRFEILNGTRNQRTAILTQRIMESLTPAYMERLADKHDLAPTGPEPWKKWLQGGSDDHSGVYIGSAHTVTKQAESVQEFLGHIRRGDHQPAGTPGGSLHLAHCLYRIAYGYYRSRFIENKGNSGGKLDIIELLMQKMIGDGAEQISRSKGLPSILYGGISHYVKSRKLRHLTDSERNLITEIGTLFSEEPIDDKLTPPSSNRKTFRLACQLSQTLSYRFLTNFHNHLSRGELLESLQTLASLGPAALSIAPYLAAFSTQHKDNHFLEDVEKHFLPERYRNRIPRKAWLTDTFSDTNGVCRTIQTVGRVARRQGKHLTVLTCLADPPESDCDLRNFAPVGCFPLPEYENQEVAFPPFLEIVEYIERHEINELVLSTPGPMGLVGLMAAKLMKIPVSGIYHTDFPQFVRSLTDDHQMEQMTWRYMIWFYEQLDHVFVPSEHYRRILTEQGIPREKITVMVRGVDRELFTPSRKDPRFKEKLNLPPDAFVFLYVGRISSDKNVECLLEAFPEVTKHFRKSHLIIVGDGPKKEEYARRYASEKVQFLGRLQGEELAATMASSDVFVFPSMTDTFGNAVLEAQASGLPVIVSETGGPSEIVAPYDSGITFNGNDSKELARQMHQLAKNSSRRIELRKKGLANCDRFTWENALHQLWTHDESSLSDSPKLKQATSLKVVEENSDWEDDIMVV